MSNLSQSQSTTILLHLQIHHINSLWFLFLLLFLMSVFNMFSPLLPTLSAQDFPFYLELGIGSLLSLILVFGDIFVDSLGIIVSLLCL